MLMSKELLSILLTEKTRIGTVEYVLNDLLLLKGLYYFVKIHEASKLSYCYKHSCTSLCVDRCFYFSGVYIYLGVEWLYVQLSKELPDCFPMWLHHSVFPLAVYEAPILPHPCHTSYYLSLYFKTLWSRLRVSLRILAMAMVAEMVVSG